MTRARNVLVAERCTRESSRPIAVNGPIRKISSRPITSGGRSRAHSTPASQTRGNGSVPRASIQASGVPSRSRTASVTPPAASETTIGSQAPGPVSALAIALPDRCVSRAITGPSSAIQITAAPATDANPDRERMVRGRAAPPGRPGPRLPGGWSPRKAPPAAAAGLAANLALHRRGDRAGITEYLRRDQRVPPLRVLRPARGGQRIGDEGRAARVGTADRRDVDGQRRAVLGLLLALARDRDRRLLVEILVRGGAEVDLGRQGDVGQVQLDGLVEVGARRVELTGLQRR